MHVLALDSSVQGCSVALLRGEQQSTLLDETPRAHAQVLLPMIHQVLEQGSMGLQDLDLLAYGCGPGSFTGLRIGLSVAQGVAFGAGIRMMPIDSLQAMAFNASQHYSATAQGAVSVIDARMGELYWAAYTWSDEGLTTLVEPRLESIEDALIAMQGAGDQSQLVLTGPGAHLTPDDWQKEWIAVDASIVPSALAVAKLSLLGAGQACMPEEAELLYLRNSVTWRKRKKIRSVD